MFFNLNSTLIFLLELIQFFEIGVTQRQSSSIGCRIHYNDAQGVCRRYFDCKSAQIILRDNRIQPTICKADDPYNPIVCCPQKQSGNTRRLSMQLNKNKKNSKSSNGRNQNQNNQKSPTLTHRNTKRPSQSIGRRPVIKRPSTSLSYRGTKRPSQPVGKRPVTKKPPTSSGHRGTKRPSQPVGRRPVIKRPSTSSSYRGTKRPSQPVGKRPVTKRPPTSSGHLGTKRPSQSLDNHVNNRPSTASKYRLTKKPPMSSSTASNTIKPITNNELENLQQQNQTRISEKKCIDAYKNFGRPFFRITIVGGINARPGEYPAMTALGWTSNTGAIDYSCGGFLVSSNYVLTAAHCSSIGGRSPSVALIGGTNLDEQNNLTRIEIMSIFVHPLYKLRQSYHDIALIKLKQHTTHLPFCLWQRNEINEFLVTAIGYGHTEFAGKQSQILQKVNLELISNDECKKSYSQSSELRNGIIDEQICAGDSFAQKDTCQGDSGGPLLVQSKVGEKIVPFVIGITSLGQACASGIPGVYTRISSYLDWIESIAFS